MRPVLRIRERLNLDQAPVARLQHFSQSATLAYCPRCYERLSVSDLRMDIGFKTLGVEAFCLQCRLEDMGLTSDEATGSFNNFVAEDSALNQILQTCREWAAEPKGALLMLGNCGTGKTHLGVAIVREQLRLGCTRLRFAKHRRFIFDHFHSLRPIAFDQEAPVSPLELCKKANLLLYDDLSGPIGTRDYQDLLLELFEHRIGNYLASIITTNLTRGALEQALGTRLFDRLCGASYACLEFGFESRRRAFNGAYLARYAEGQATAARNQPEDEEPLFQDG
jgi:DNA replication protein DnaC